MGGKSSRYFAAAEGFAVSPENVLIIEDSERGLSLAMITGIRCVIVKNEFTEHQNFTGATAKIDALTELPDLLGNRLPSFHRD